MLSSSSLSFCNCCSTWLILIYAMGTDTPMTVNAIESLHQSSPGLNIGIITQDIDAARLALSHIPARFTFMPRSEHFAGWNPTQFKLDMLQFGSLFETVVWMDSDTFVVCVAPALLWVVTAVLV